LKDKKTYIEGESPIKKTRWANSGDFNE